jgi:hypothetical protein
MRRTLLLYTLLCMTAINAHLLLFVPVSKGSVHVSGMSLLANWQRDNGGDRSPNLDRSVPVWTMGGTYEVVSYGWPSIWGYYTEPANYLTRTHWTVDYGHFLWDIVVVLVASGLAAFATAIGFAKVLATKKFFLADVFKIVTIGALFGSISGSISIPFGVFGKCAVVYTFGTAIFFASVLLWHLPASGRKRCPQSADLDNRGCGEENTAH